jgi:ketosteroid isomerase-like protein
MSQENVEVVRRMWEAFRRRDFDQSLAAFYPDIEWDGTNLPDGTVSRGHQAIIDHSARWFGMWEDWTIELGEFVDVGDEWSCSSASGVAVRPASTWTSAMRRSTR